MKDHLDGPKVVAWLESEIPQLFDGEHRDDRLTRRIYDWRHGRLVSVWKLDELLSQHGRHIYELPDDYYVDRAYNAPPRPEHAYPQRLREAILKAVEDGHAPGQVAEWSGVAVRTIYTWRRRAKEAA